MTEAKRKLRTNGTSKAETTTIRLRPGDTPDERMMRLNDVIGVYGAKRTLIALAEALRTRGRIFEATAEDLAQHDQDGESAYQANIAARFLKASKLLEEAAGDDFSL